MPATGNPFEFPLKVKVDMKRLILSLLPLSVLLASCSSIPFTQPKKQIIARVSSKKITCGLSGKSQLERLLKEGWKIKSFQVATYDSSQSIWMGDYYVGVRPIPCVDEIYLLEK